MENTTITMAVATVIMALATVAMSIAAYYNFKISKENSDAEKFRDLQKALNIILDIILENPQFINGKCVIDYNEKALDPDHAYKYPITGRFLIFSHLIFNFCYQTYIHHNKNKTKTENYLTLKTVSFKFWIYLCRNQFYDTLTNPDKSGRRIMNHGAYRSYLNDLDFIEFIESYTPQDRIFCILIEYNDTPWQLLGISKKITINSESEIEPPWEGCGLEACKIIKSLEVGSNIKNLSIITVKNYKDQVLEIVNQSE